MRTYSEINAGTTEGIIQRSYVGRIHPIVTGLGIPLPRHSRRWGLSLCLRGCRRYSVLIMSWIRRLGIMGGVGLVVLVRRCPKRAEYSTKTKVSNMVVVLRGVLRLLRLLLKSRVNGYF